MTDRLAKDQRDWDIRLAAARGEATPLSPAGWARLVLRALAAGPP